MAFNPSKQGEPLDTPINGRKNSTNDPGYENKQGYYPYDLSHTEVFTPRYGEVIPSMHLLTIPGDRHVVRDDNKLILNQINGNFLNTINQYVDSFFVSNRTMFPSNWDKLIPNPVKGDDLPNSARPVVPLYAYIGSFLYDTNEFSIAYQDLQDVGHIVTVSNYSILNGLSLYQDTLDQNGVMYGDNAMNFSYLLANLSFASYLVSRGQLLDHLGVQFDLTNTRDYLSSFQHKIDAFYLAYWRFVHDNHLPMFNIELNPSSDILGFNVMYDSPAHTISELSQFRDRYMTAFERGELLVPYLLGRQIVIGDSLDEFFSAISDLITAFNSIFREAIDVNLPTIDEVNLSDNFNERGRFINISKCLAYQLCISQYFTNDSIDNIFTSDLYMQLLRGTMFPSVNNITSEPTFDYNGVPTEYDYISYGAWYTSLFSAGIPGRNSRAFLVGSLLFILRRSLRFGDYFTTGRTRMLAVGQLSVPVDGDMSVNPVDVTLGLVTQRFLNAANRVGNKPIAYYASILGVTPSDMPSIPRYVSHRKIVLENRVTTNTAQDQGAQTTNLVGYSDNMAFDVFIDDYGVLISLNSFDCLPIYNSGIDADNYLSDRFEYFNPMMQNIGDQPIRLSELISGSSNYDTTFAYTVRNAEYKYKNSRAHGNICYNMPGYLLKFPVYRFHDLYGNQRIEHIDPDFIRDKPSILDPIIKENTGVSPGDYFHFVISVHNEVKSARLIQKAPDILF